MEGDQGSDSSSGSSGGSSVVSDDEQISPAPQPIPVPVTTSVDVHSESLQAYLNAGSTLEEALIFAGIALAEQEEAANPDSPIESISIPLVNRQINQPVIRPEGNQPEPPPAYGRGVNAFLALQAVHGGGADNGGPRPRRDDYIFPGNIGPGAIFQPPATAKYRGQPPQPRGVHQDQAFGAGNRTVSLQWPQRGAIFQPPATAEYRGPPPQPRGVHQDQAYGSVTGLQWPVENQLIQPFLRPQLGNQPEPPPAYGRGANDASLAFQVARGGGVRFSQPPVQGGAHGGPRPRDEHFLTGYAGRQRGSLFQPAARGELPPLARGVNPVQVYGAGNRFSGPGSGDGHYGFLPQYRPGYRDERLPTYCFSSPAAYRGPPPQQRDRDDNPVQVYGEINRFSVPGNGAGFFPHGDGRRAHPDSNRPNHYPAPANADQWGPDGAQDPANADNRRRAPPQGGPRPDPGEPNPKRKRDDDPRL